MKITKVSFKEPQATYSTELEQIVEITIDDAIKVKDLHLCKSAKGYYLGFPRRKTKDGHYYEIFCCTEHSVRNYIFKEVMSAYNNR